MTSSPLPPPSSFSSSCPAPSTNQPPILSAVLSRDSSKVREEIQKIFSSSSSSSSASASFSPSPSPSLTELLNGISHSPYGAAPLHIAALNNDVPMLELLISLRFPEAPESFQIDLNVRDKNGHTPLHFAANEGALEALRLLTGQQQQRVDLIPRNEDMFLRFGNSIPIYVTGGRTPLHLAAENGEEEAAFFLLSKGASPLLRDLDGNTPAALAVLKGYRNLALKMIEYGHGGTNGYGGEEANRDRQEVEHLLSLSKEELASLVREQEMARRARIDQNSKALRDDELLEKQKRDFSQGEEEERLSKEQVEKYKHLHKHPDLLRLDLKESRYFDSRFLEAMIILRKSLDSGSLLLNESQIEEHKRRFGIKEIASGVFELSWMFTLEFCSQMFEDALAIESTPGIEIRRPNSMNSYGLVFDDFGFNFMFHQLVKTHLEPLGKLLFPAILGATSLNSHHAFMVRYKKGEDEALDEHVDNSLLTLNLCLGKEGFTGGQLYFRGLLGKPGAEEEYWEYVPKPGTVILHLGRHLHGVHKLKGGERCNMIVWCRN